MESLKSHIYFNWLSPEFGEKLCMKDNYTIFCTSSIGPHKTIYGDILLTPNGTYYWEILIKKGSYFKIGIADKNSILKNDKKGSFSDSIGGYAYYSMGELRNNNNYKGNIYGTGYGMGDVIGILLNSIDGTLKFFLNDKDLGIAFKDLKLKTCYFVPAVSCLLKEESFMLKFSEKED